MKKIRIFTLILAAVCLCTLLASCTQESNCAHEYDNECDSECNICSEKRTALSHLWHSVDQELCQYKQTCAWCGLTMGENVEHSYTDANGNVLNECAICGAKNPTPPNESNQNNTQGGSNTDPTPEPNPTPDDKPEINTTTLQYTYDYGWHVLGELTLLCDDGHLHIDGIEKPADIVAGDMIKIVHTGSIWTQESYPATHSLSSGGYLISYSFEYATVIHLGSYGYSIENVKSQYDLDEEYVIVDRTGNFVPLDEYNGDEIYLVVDQKRYPYYGNGDFTDIDMEYPEEIIPIASMFAYNPRDLGEINDMPEKLEPITEQEAKDIASAHFYNDSTIYPLPDGYAYKAITVEGFDASCHYVLFDPEYLGEPYEQILFDHFTYLYKVNKITGEIVDISSDF